MLVGGRLESKHEGRSRNRKDGSVCGSTQVPDGDNLRRNAFKLNSIEAKDLKTGCAVASLQRPSASTPSQPRHRPPDTGSFLFPL